MADLDVRNVSVNNSTPTLIFSGKGVLRFPAGVTTYLGDSSMNPAAGDAWYLDGSSEYQLPLEEDTDVYAMHPSGTGDRTFLVLPLPAKATLTVDC